MVGIWKWVKNPRFIAFQLHCVVLECVANIAFLHSIGISLLAFDWVEVYKSETQLISVENSRFFIIALKHLEFAFSFSFSSQMFCYREFKKKIDFL